MAGHLQRTDPLEAIAQEPARTNLDHLLRPAARRAVFHHELDLALEELAARAAAR